MGNCFNFCMSSSESDMLLPEHQDPDSSSPASPISVDDDQSQEPVFYVTPNTGGLPASQLSEDEQIKLAKRMGFIQQLPSGLYDWNNKNRECAICMCDFVIGDNVRYLPCLHIYHATCIDDWLMRSFTCPSCMESVDAALLSTFQTN